jgi:hypothetical protein
LTVHPGAGRAGVDGTFQQLRGVVEGIELAMVAHAVHVDHAQLLVIQRQLCRRFLSGGRGQDE